MSEAVCILPARGGSKRIPRKNVAPFCGRPMIAWPIAAARASGLFARIIVSTEDAEIAQVAEAEGAEVPFRRDADLADDFSTTTEVIRDAVDRLDLAPGTVVCCLYATAALVTPAHLRQGLAALAGDATGFAMSMVALPSPFQRSYRLEGARAVPFFPDQMPLRSQDLEPAYADAGQFYFATAAQWREPDRRPWDNARPVILDRWDVCDIDEPADWKFAEALKSIRS
ncbi:pseudaminic acid cytidylyltransferase [Oceanomicrobium pacificus]|uniref:Pseudaminic acid cytidylyltransferase n=1 Tax=Oceanomicrobium pacificus TaxID=2692916 RepID=A0A6B0TUW7_9RHOB|nr:pseudaminic acid cytidylyltransferase [Oceanomicrobium pacificus]MXU66609.1 pseudaminic acid cytidylyltransferase [Oceanomicrobium pacificus]